MSDPNDALGSSAVPLEESQSVNIDSNFTASSDDWDHRHADLTESQLEKDPEASDDSPSAIRRLSERRSPSPGRVSRNLGENARAVLKR